MLLKHLWLVDFELFIGTISEEKSFNVFSIQHIFLILFLIYFPAQLLIILILRPPYSRRLNYKKNIIDHPIAMFLKMFNFAPIF